MQIKEFKPKLANLPLHHFHLTLCRFLILLVESWRIVVISGTVHRLLLKTSFHPLLWTSCGPDEVHSSGWKLVFNNNLCTVPEITTILQDSFNIVSGLGVWWKNKKSICSICLYWPKWLLWQTCCISQKLFALLAFCWQLPYFNILLRWRCASPTRIGSFRRQSTCIP